MGIYNDYVCSLPRCCARVLGGATDTLLFQTPIRAHDELPGMSTCAGSAPRQMHHGELAKAKCVSFTATLLTRSPGANAASAPRDTYRRCPRAGLVPLKVMVLADIGSKYFNGRVAALPDLLPKDGTKALLRRVGGHALVGGKAGGATRKRIGSAQIGISRERFGALSRLDLGTAPERPTPAPTPAY